MKFVQDMAAKLSQSLVAEQAVYYNPNPSANPASTVTYAPISSLEGAIAGLIPIKGRQQSVPALISTVIADLEKWYISGVSVPGISLDLSAEESLSQDDLEAVLALGKKYPKRIEVGVSEAQLMSDWQKTKALIQEYTEAGLLLGIKKFGTGYSSLSFLKELPISTLWIDKSFVESVVSEPGDRATIAAINDIATSLNIPAVVAEGVSNAEQSKALLGIGVKSITGSMAGDAMTGEEVYKRIST
jgi:EAL domain-containing protein (putative c-di-GMP-specific phosphodiesterase class I)